MSTSHPHGPRSGGRLRGLRRRTIALLATTAVGAGMLVTLSVAQAPGAAAATLTSDLSVNVVAARSVNSGPGFVQAGDPIANFQYTLQKIDVGNENDKLTNCAPPVNNTATTTYDPQFPNNCQWPGTRLSNSGDPIISTGTEADIANITGLADGKYIISVKADGYEIGGSNFTAPMSGPVQVKLQPGPLPLATVRVRVYQDIAPVDGTYEIDAEPGIAGFRGFLNDMLGDVSTDFFGNPLCTSYVHGAPDAQHPQGQIEFGADGKPVIAPDNTGQCISDANGDLVFPNMAPGRYGITVRQSADRKNWYQTTTLEGAQDHDWWVMAGDTGYGSETTYGSELVPEVQFGFFPPRTTADALPAPTNNPAVLSALGTASITGALHEGCKYIGSPGGQVGGLAPQTAGSEVKDCGALSNGVVAVSALDLGDQLVASTPTNKDGTFEVPNLANGNYMVTFFDNKMNHILDTMNVTITNDQSENIGTQFIQLWFGKVTGYVFVDSNGNGKRDPGEQGVQGTTLTVRERDNTPMDQFTNTIQTDANGHYTVDQTYPLARWLIFEHFDPRFKPTGYTTQSCNDKKSHTYTGSAVDISVLPVLGLCTTIDWAVQPLAAGETGGVAGTVTYGTTRNELDASQAATENWQPGIPNVPVHLFAVVKNADGTPATNPDGSYVHGPELADPYTSESYQRPSGCTALDKNGNLLTQQKALPAAGDPTLSCPESNMYGTQAAPADTTPGNDAQPVQGNYGFSSSKLNLIDPNAAGYDPTDPANPKDDAGNPLSLYAPLDGTTIGQTYTYPQQQIKPGDYIVSVDIPKDSYGKDMYQPTKEEDINVFSGDAFLPQENMPPSDPAAAGGSVGAGTPAPGITSGLGESSGCVGPNHTVHVTNPDFLANGGSPFEGQSKPLCTDKIVQVADGGTGATNFELFTDVPLATHFWGLTINDLGLQTDPKSLGFDEAEGLKHAPTGIYDWAGNLIDTAVSDPSGFYEAVVPSTNRINNPSPTGVSPGMYRFVGNDPGVPGHLNPTYDPRYRTIATNFQAWPGLWTVTDTAPQAAASSTFSGSMTNVKCDVSTAEPQIFAVNNPVASGATTLTITGRDFGTGQDYRDAVLLGNPNDAAADPAKATPLTVTSWTDTAITAQVPAASSTFAPGPRELLVSNSGKYSSNGLTIHVLGTGSGSSYNPTLFEVGPGKAYNTDTGATLQSAVEAAAARGASASTLVVAYPLTPNANSPRGDYTENVVLHSGVKLQGVGAGGFQADGTWVPGSIINGEQFQEGSPNGVAWMNLVAGIDNAVPSVTVPDAATITVLTPAGGTSRTTSTTASGTSGAGTITVSFLGTAAPFVGATVTGTGIGAGATVTAIAGRTVTLSVPNAGPVSGTVTFSQSAAPAIDGFQITGGHEQNVPTNINVITNGNQTPYGSAGATITQGGGIYVHGGSDGLTISNDVINGNSGSYAGGIRVGTAYVNGNIGQNDTGATPLTNYTITNTHLTVAHNRVLNNGGSNLAGGIGIFSGTPGYRLAYNDVCGNFGAEYGGGISHYGLSRQGRIDHNRIWFNQSFDHSGGLMLGGELTLNPSDLSGGTGEVTVDNNRFDQNLANDDGGGIGTLNAGNWKIKVENNEIVGNVSTHEGGGVALNNTSNMVLDNNTIANNVTTATAATSNGQPAAAGVATSALDAMLASTLPAGSPTFTRPVAFNNTFWDNRAGYYDGVSVHGIGQPGDAAAVNLWDIGSQDSSGLVPVSHSILNTYDGTTSSVFVPGSNISIDPAFVKPYPVTVQVDGRRSLFAFRQTVITNQLTNPWDTGDYSIPSTSSAISQGAASVVDSGTTYTAPAFDIVGTERKGHVDAGAFQYAPPPTVPSAPNSAIVTPQDKALRVSWLVPSSDGGLALGNYTARAYDAATGGNLVGSCVTAGLTCTIPGLVNGTTYYVEVVASNAVGVSPATFPRVIGVPATAPDAPTGVVVTPQRQSLAVSWTAPVNNGGSAVTGYTATAYASNTPRNTITILGVVIDLGPNPDYTRVVGTPCTTTGALSCTITGLAAGTTYWVSVTATNVAGTSPASSPRVSGTSFGDVPSAPRNVTAATAPGGVDVTWAAPSSNGGTPVLSYTAKAYTASSGGTAVGTCGPTAANATTCRISGLTAGTTYWVEVTANNAAGDSIPSSPRASAAAGVLAAPSAPTGVAATRGDGQGVVRWTAPNANGSAITGYTATAYTALTGGTAVANATCTTATTTCTVTGLTNGTTYYVSVTATNGVGTGTASAPRVAVTPATTATLTNVAVTARNNGNTRQLVVSWTSNNGGSNVTTSTVRVFNAATGGTQTATCIVFGAGTTCTAPGFAQGTLAATTNYWVTVESTNGVGTSAATARLATRTL